MPQHNQRQAVALFRYGLIAEFVHLPLGSPGLYAKLQAKSNQAYTIPGSTRVRVATETLRDWLKKYRRGGFDALLPQYRSDRGRSRALPPEVADRLLSLKEDFPQLSIPQLIRTALERGIAANSLPRTTVHRLFSRSGLMRKDSNGPTDLDQRRIAYAHAGQLWVSDVMHGPTVAVGKGVRRNTYLIAFIDVATRVVPYCAFALSENTQTFLLVFKQALLRRAIPERLFVDIGPHYYMRHIAHVCAKLGIAMIHAHPYQHPGNSKQERFFGSLRAQFLTRLTADDTASLDALNRRLWVWIDGEYHQTPQRGLDGLTPLEHWSLCGDQLRLPIPDLNLDDLFLFEVKRRVQHDRTVRLNGAVSKVDAFLVGETITLRFDPAAPASLRLEVWNKGAFVGCAKPVDV